MKLIFKYLFISILLISITSCSEEDSMGSTIFDLSDDIDESSESYEFDIWLKDAYLSPYNLEFRYKMEDVSSDMEYNLVPAYYDKSQEMAMLVKYLWFDAYAAVAEDGVNFLKANGPKIIQLIGSPAYNIASQTRVLGTAEAGILVTLYDCNSVDHKNISQMNTRYFNTMHHEFAHILHQKKTYPVEFDDISKGNYNPVGWNNRTEAEAAQLGFVSRYGSSQPREDFVEVISNYLVKSDSEWAAILDLATNTAVEMDGRTIILAKLEICRSWLRDAWKIDIDGLRNEIKVRQDNIDELYN